MYRKCRPANLYDTAGVPLKIAVHRDEAIVGKGNEVAPLIAGVGCALSEPRLFQGLDLSQSRCCRDVGRTAKAGDGDPLRHDVGQIEVEKHVPDGIGE